MLLLPDDFHEHACITLVLHIYSIRISGLILKLRSVVARFFFSAKDLYLRVTTIVHVSVCLEIKIVSSLSLVFVLSICSI